MFRLRKTIVVLIILVIIIFNSSCNNNDNIQDANKKISNSKIETKNRAEEMKFEIGISEKKYNLDSLISTERLKDLSQNELSILRNAIHAKYGYRFKSSEYSEYFSKIEWYKPRFDNVSNILTDIDLQNIDNIVKLENAKKALDPQNNNDDTSFKAIQDEEIKLAGDTLKSSTGVVKIAPVAEKYIDYMKEKDSNYDIIFFAKKDIDLDGNYEVVIASGTTNEKNTPTYISKLYVLRENNGRIEQLGGNLAEGGYSVYSIDLIQLNNMYKKYIYLGLTNGAGMIGFKIYELSDDKPKAICYSASPTGLGSDELKDFDNDGQFDGYIQNRSSYDVLYYSLSRTYMLENNEFILKSTYIEVPQYPDNIKDVLIQYISLRVLDKGKSPEISKRLSDLCIYEKAGNVDFPSDVWHSALYNTIMLMDNKIQFDISKEANIATAIYLDENNKEHKREFHLIKLDNRWCIDNMNILN